MFEKDKAYTRLEIEKIINPTRVNGAQGSYYTLTKTNGEEVGVSFLNKVSIYENQIIGKSSIQWQDSTGKKSKSGMNHLSHKENYFFKEFSNKGSKKYVLIGKVKYFSQIASGQKWVTPSTFKIEFESNISNIVLDLFDDSIIVREREELVSGESSRAFGVTDPVKASYIGRIGEEIFNQLFQSKDETLFSQLKEKIFEMDPNDFIWQNSNQESYAPYDFVISGEKLDVKTTTRVLNDFYVSENEKKLLDNGELLIALVHIGENNEFVSCKIIDSKYISQKYEISPLKYFAKEII